MHDFITQVDKTLTDRYSGLRLQIGGKMSDFFKKINKFNEMYKIPNLSVASRAEKLTRLEQFEDILKEEFDEIEDIYDANDLGESDIFIKVAMADWLGDMIVYCASEAVRLGIDIEGVLDIIMESNFSKLQPDGSASFDERGKLLKGPNYWKPEANIRILLEKKKK